MKSNIVNWAIVIIVLVSIAALPFIIMRHGDRRYREGVCAMFELKQSASMVCSCEVKSANIEVSCWTKIDDHIPTF